MQGKFVPFLSFVLATGALLFGALLATSAYLDPSQATDFSELLVSKAQATTDLTSVAHRPAEAEPSLADKLRARPLR